MEYICGGCKNTWKGYQRCHCSACHETFAGADLFDRHRRLRGEHGVCLDPALIVGKDGDREMWLTDGCWYGVEQPVSRGFAKTGQPS